MNGCVISGSMRRFLPEMAAAGATLESQGFTVLSPRSFTLTGEARSGFVLVAGDEGDPEEIQQRHLDAIAVSEFVWLVCPEGYVGESGLFEVGFAHGLEIPVFAAETPAPAVIRRYVQVVELSTLRR